MPSFSSFASAGGAHQSAPASRSSSVASNVSVSSHKSVPTRKIHNDEPVPATRSLSLATNLGHPVKHSFFSAEGRAERKEKKRLEQEKISKVVLTSKHAAAVKTRMLLEQRNRKPSTTNTANVTGTINSAHMTAAQQEARLPHSGPPSKHTMHKDHERDMPLLTRITSCDENDEEEEQLVQHRNDWLAKKADVGMDRVRESSSVTEADLEVLEGVAVGGASRTNSDSSQGKPTKAKTHFGAWSRNEAGVWTR